MKSTEGDIWNYIDSKFCRCGTACGLLADAPFVVLFAFWLLRHSIYGLIIYGIWVADPPTVVWQLLGAFIIINHSYKALAYVFRRESIKDEDSSHNESNKASTMVVAQHKEPSKDFNINNQRSQVARSEVEAVNVV